MLSLSKKEKVIAKIIGIGIVIVSMLPRLIFGDYICGEVFVVGIAVFNLEGTLRLCSKINNFFGIKDEEFEDLFGEEEEEQDQQKGKVLVFKHKKEDSNSSVSNL